MDEYYATENLPAEQTSIEQGLSGLQLSDPDESERNGSSFDSDSADRRRGSFSSGRHSVDMSQSSSDYSANVLRSSLRDNEYGSMRYSTSRNSTSAAHGRPSLLSRATSKLRAIGLKSKTKASAACDEQVIVSTQLHIYAARTPATDIRYEDAELIKESVANGYPTEHATRLRRLSRALAENDQPPFAGRLHDLALDEVARTLHHSVLSALNALRAMKGVPAPPPRRKDPSAGLKSEDAELIKESVANGYPRQYASWLRILSRVLAENDQPPFAARLHDLALDEVGRTINSSVITALRILRDMKGIVVAPHYSQDEDLIQRFVKAYEDGLAKELAADTARRYSNALRELSRWCFAENRGAIADRLTDRSFLIEAKALGEERGGSRLYTPALKALRRFASRPDVISLVDLPRSPEEQQQVDLSRQGRSRLSLGPEQWLGDEHIHRDYELLEEELRQNAPNLADRTRLADPLIVNYSLRLGWNREVAFQRIVNDRRTGNDTADFLFLPVSDASATDPARRGSHWSLLFVDRRDRSNPVAFHYDSLEGYHREAAVTIARNLGAYLVSPEMAQQRNGYDCGVYVVDGTRELVRRLAEGPQPNLWNLDEVVADRQQLQRRLS
ncbi:Ulp1 family isopeptidase, partial [Bradyrhizobium sp. LeoA1S1]